MPPSRTAPVVPIASRTKISTSQRRHFRIAYAKASGINTRGTTATVESSGDSRPKARGSAESIRNGARPTMTPRPIQRTCFSASASCAMPAQERRRAARSRPRRKAAK